MGILLCKPMEQVKSNGGFARGSSGVDTTHLEMLV